MAQGKFSKPRQTNPDTGARPVPPPVPVDPIETVPQEIADFLSSQEPETACTPGWQDKTQVVPDNWRDATQVAPGNWADTRKVPDTWRESTQVVPEYPRQAPQRAPQPTEEWDFEEEPRPTVRNHMVDDTDPLDYDYEQPPQGNSRKPVIIGLCVLVLVLLLAGILLVTKAFGSKQADDDGLILSHVMAAGIDLGGMTKEQALVALSRATDNTYSQQSMVVILPDSVLELDPDDTEAKLNVPAVVEAAYQYGRNGTKSENQKAKDNAQAGKVHTIALLPYLTLDEDFIRAALNDYAAYFNSTYQASAFRFQGVKPELRGDKFDENAPCQLLVIETGMPGRAVDAGDILDQVLDAYSFHVFEVTAAESVPEQIPEAIDLDKIFKDYCSTAIDAYMDMQTFEVITETYGYTFDLENAKARLAETAYGETLEIQMEYIVPEIMGEKLEEMLFRDTLASYETPTTSDNNRNTNLKLACQAINGTLLNPGDSFSFNDALGQRTEAAGYKKAGAIYGGEAVTEVGGGICQVSSTLYVCVLNADLDVTARSPHSTPVSYVPLGLDAAVSWGGPEFKFRNDTDYPLRIDAEVSGGYVKIKLIGTDERDTYVKVETKEEAIQPEIQYQDFPWDNPEGYADGDILEEGVTGYTVKTYKYYYSKADDSLVSQAVEATSTYQSKAQVVARVEPKPTEPPTEPPTEAPEEETENPVQEVIDNILDLING